MGKSDPSDPIYRGRRFSPEVIQQCVRWYVTYRLSYRDLVEISGHLDAGGSSSRFEEFESWDAKLHRSIALAARNGVLLSMFDVMNSARTLPVWGSLKRRTSSPERRQEYHAQHTLIVDALHDRDPEAAEHAMREHLRSVRTTLLGSE